MNGYNVLAAGIIDKLPVHNVALKNKFFKQKKYFKKIQRLSTYTYKRRKSGH